MDPKNSFGPVFFWLLVACVHPFRVFDRGKVQGVRIILERSECIQYVKVFKEKGYDSAGHLLPMIQTHGAGRTQQIWAQKSCIFVPKFIFSRSLFGIQSKNGTDTPNFAGLLLQVCSVSVQNN